MKPIHECQNSEMMIGRICNMIRWALDMVSVFYESFSSFYFLFRFLDNSVCSLSFFFCAWFSIRDIFDLCEPMWMRPGDLKSFVIFPFDFQRCRGSFIWLSRILINTILNFCDWILSTRIHPFLELRFSIISPICVDFFFLFSEQERSSPKWILP